MLRLLFTTTFCIALFILGSECRMGWKNNGNEYLVYSANASSSSRTNSFNITGTFSITRGKLSWNQLVAGEDPNLKARYGEFKGLFAVSVSGNHSSVFVSVTKGRSASSVQAWSLGDFSSGNAFDFTVTVTQSQVNSEYNNSVTLEIKGYPSVTAIKMDKTKWNLDNMKLFVGGVYLSNSSVTVKPTYFHGCLSNVMFQGVDIIAKYFSQYPNNINPLRGSRVGPPPYATAMQNCGDVTPTKKPGAAVSCKASVFILVAGFLLVILSF